MSREVRRVPPGYQHPVQVRPGFQVSSSDADQCAPMDYVPLRAGYAADMDRWADEVRDIQDRAGTEWAHHIQHTLTGYIDDEGTFIEPTNSVVVDMGGFEFAVPVGCAETLRENLLKSKLDVRPDPGQYMPDFVGTEPLGWCLYSGELGVPLTPIFDSPDELIDHLVSTGVEGDDLRYSQESAQALTGFPAPFSV